MAEFLAQNTGNLIVGIIVLAVVVVAILRVRKTRKSGGCGCGCEGCASAGMCQPGDQTE